MRELGVPRQVHIFRNFHKWFLRPLWIVKDLFVLLLSCCSFENERVPWITMILWFSYFFWSSIWSSITFSGILERCSRIVDLCQEFGSHFHMVWSDHSWNNFYVRVPHVGETVINDTALIPLSSCWHRWTMRRQAHLFCYLLCCFWFSIEVAKNNSLDIRMSAMGLSDEELDLSVCVLLISWTWIVSDCYNWSVPDVYHSCYCPARPEVFKQRRYSVLLRAFSCILSWCLNEEHHSFSSCVPRWRLKQSDVLRKRWWELLVAPCFGHGHYIIRASYDMMEERVSPVLVPNTVRVESHRWYWVDVWYRSVGYLRQR